MQTGGAELFTVFCPQCGTALKPTAGPPRRPSSFADLLRRCDPCGVGYSNARLDPVLIYRDAAANVPPEVRAGLDRVLDSSLNVRNRNQKRFKFGSHNSEDAVTWAVFSFLARSRPEALRALGRRWLDADITPTALIWGVPVPDQPRATKIRDRLVSILDTIGESPGSRSEPDLILDYQEAGLVVIEVKLGSKNDENTNPFKMDPYLALSVGFKNIQEVKESRLYQLTRNWRFGWDLASGRPFRLINLGPTDLFEANDKLDRFSRGISVSDRTQFIRETWPALLAELDAAIHPIPQWLSHWLSARLPGKGDVRSLLT